MDTNYNSEIFKDLVILELASVLAGPAVGLFFAELGAKVIKIENSKTGGDVTRSWKHPNEDNSKSSAYYHSVNWNKKVIMTDLSDLAERTKILDLIKTADVLISNFRSGSAVKLGMDYESLKKINPALIYGSISAYSPADPRPGFDALLQAETGWMHMNGQADGPPTKMPVALIDILAAHQLKEGILVALIRKLKSGKGSHVTVSLYDAALSALANQGSNYLNLNVIPKRKGSLHPNIAPYGEVFQTQDQEPILLAIGNDEQFKNLCALLNIPEICTDEKYALNTNRVKNRISLNKLLGAAFEKISSDQLLITSEKKKIPLGRIRNLQQVFENELSKPMVLDQKEADGSTSKRVRTAVFKLS